MGRIISQYPDGRYLIDFNGLRSKTDIQFPATIGETLLTEVIQIGPPLKLKIQTPPSATGQKSFTPPATRWAELASALPQLHRGIARFFKLISHLPHHKRPPENIQKSLQFLADQLRPLNIAADPSVFLPRLTASLLHSGLFFEKNLARMIQMFFHPANETEPVRDIPAETLNPVIKKDLKPHLLRLSRFMNSPHSPPFTSEVHSHWNRIRTGVNLLLNHIGEQHRQVSERRNDTQASLFFDQLFFVNPSHQKACLRIYTPHGSKTSRQNDTRISLLLDLNRIGSVRTDLTLFENNLQVVFFVSSEDIKQHFNKHLSDLTPVLETLFSTLKCHVHVSSRKISEFLEVDIVRRSDSTIDMRV